jgi:hypothetical protein
MYVLVFQETKSKVWKLDNLGIYGEDELKDLLDAVPNIDRMWNANIPLKHQRTYRVMKLVDLLEGEK